jgi:hypothetical protein
MHWRPATSFCRGPPIPREGWDVRSELPEERDHGIADRLMLLSSLRQAVATWRYLGNISTALLWKFYRSLGPIFFFALAGVTRRAETRTGALASRFASSCQLPLEAIG